MVESDREEFRLAMAAMAEMYRVECPVSMQKTYWLVCQSMTIEQFKSAVVKAMKELKWFPKPAELFELVHGNTQDRAEGAWLALNRAIDDVGGYRSPKFTDGVLRATVEALGGWQYLCGMSTREFESFVRPKFLETYQSFLKTGTTSDRPLVGIHDQQNGRIGSKHVAALVGELGLEQKRIGIDS